MQILGWGGVGEQAISPAGVEKAWSKVGGTPHILSTATSVVAVGVTDCPRPHQLSTTSTFSCAALPPGYASSCLYLGGV